jgi:hypothetical protein
MPTSYVAPAVTNALLPCDRQSPDHPVLAPGIAGSIQPLPLVWPTQQITSMAISPAFATDRTLLIGDDRGVYRSTDAGTTWSTHKLDAIATVLFSPNYVADHTIFAVGSFREQGTSVPTVRFFHSRDQGATWTRQVVGGSYATRLQLMVSPTYAQDQTLFVLASGDGGGAFQGGSLFRSTDGGGTWIANDSGAPAPYRIALSPTYTNDHTLLVSSYAIGAAQSTSNGIYRSTDGGTTWAVVKQGWQSRWFDNAFLTTTLAQLLRGMPTEDPPDAAPEWWITGEIGVSPRYADDHTLFALMGCGDSPQTSYQLVRNSDTGGSPQAIVDFGTEPLLYAPFGVAASETHSYIVVILSREGRAWRLQLDSL